MPALADHAEAVVREAVSKLSGTPAPPPLSINVNVEDELSIEVIDNGRGISGDITGSGLVKLRERARDAGGSFAIEPAPSGGTVLRWSAPLPWTDLRLRSLGPTALVARPGVGERGCQWKAEAEHAWDIGGCRSH